MSEHTKEPWKSGPNGLNILDPKTGFLIATTHSNNLNRRADIRRIVACVNACAGIPTHGLEGIRFAVTLAEFADCQQQRDELLAALTEIRNCDTFFWIPFEEGSPIDLMLKRADAAIDAARGG